jgi:hypothetical protein
LLELLGQFDFLSKGERCLRGCCSIEAIAAFGCARSFAEESLQAYGLD